MKAPKNLFPLAGALVLALVGSAVVVACSGDDNATTGPTNVPMMDAGNTQDSTTQTGTDSGNATDTGTTMPTTDGGTPAPCDMNATNPLLGCAPGSMCAGYYDNAAHHVPVPPTPKP